MKTIYVVTKGCYSDYSIEGAFSSETKALAFCKHYKIPMDNSYDAARIEVYDLDQLYNRIKEGIDVYLVRMDWNGNILESKKTDWREDLGDPRSHVDGKCNFFMWVSAKSVEGAIKIANERRLQVKANPDPETQRAIYKWERDNNVPHS